MIELNEIFDQLKAVALGGFSLQAPDAPNVEPELRPFVLRRMTESEIALMAARDAAKARADKMITYIETLRDLNISLNPMPGEIRQNELIKFHATMLEDLFFWMIEENTGWRFVSLLQRKDNEGHLVLVGLTWPEATAYLERLQEQQDVAAVERLNEYPEEEETWEWEGN